MRFFAALLLIISLSANAQIAVTGSRNQIRTYYVSAAGTGDGTLANPWGPSQAQDNVPFLPAGCTVLFNKGDSFNNIQLNVNKKLSIDEYGSGAHAILNGSTDIGAQVWTSEGSSIYSTPYTSTFNWLYSLGIAAKMAETGWYTITAQPAANKLRATTLISAWGSSIVGATVVVREYYFTLSKPLTVTAYNNATGEITLSDNIRFPSTDFLNGFTFKLFNQQQFIDTEGEFYYSSSQGKVYYRTAGSSPAGTDVRVCTKNNGVLLADGTTDVTINGIQFTQYYNSAINGKTTHRLHLTSLNINNIRGNGLFIYGPATGVQISGLTINKCGQNGMLLGGLVSPVVASNTLTNIGRELTIPFSQYLGTSFANWEQTNACGIAFTYDKYNTTSNAVSGGYVYQNSFTNMGYCGVNYTGSLDSVSYNRVDQAMQDYQDGGGIYCVANPQSPYFTVTNGTRIRKNIVTNTKGLYENCPLAHPSLNTWGIYIDYQCHSMIIERNTIVNADGGLMKLNYGGGQHTIQDNNMVGGHWGVQFNNDAVNYSANTGNNFQRNAIGTAWYPMTFSDLSDGTFNPFIASGGNCDNNFYLNPYADLVGRQLSSPLTSYTLAAWRTLMGDDASSTKFASPYSYSGNFTTEQYEAIIHLNETMSNASYTIPSGYVDKNGTTAGNSITIPPYEGIVLIKTSTAAEVYDSFTGTNGTAITAHTPEVGGAWSLRSGTMTISSNTLVASVVGNATQTTTHSDVNVMAQASRGSTASNINLVFRHNGLNTAANETYYLLFWAADLLQLFSIAAGGGGTLLASTPQQLTASTNYYVEARVIGTRVLIKVDGETKIDYTGLSINPTSLIHGVHQPTGTGANTTTFAISGAQ